MLALFSKCRVSGIQRFVVYAALCLEPIAVRAHDVIGNVAPRNYESRTGRPGQQLENPRISEARRKILSLMADATSMTAQGNLNAAEAAYRTVLTLDPGTGAPALARFLRLTGQAVTSGDLASRLLTDIPETSAPIRARVLVAVGETTAARDLILGSAKTTILSEPGMAVFAANLLRGPELAALRAGVLAEAATSGTTNAIRSQAFDHFLADPSNMASLPVPDFLRVLAAGFDLVAADDPRRLGPALDELLLTLMMRPDYFPSRRDLFFREASDSGPAGVWLVARLLIREEKHEEALQWIQKHEEAYRDHRIWPMLGFEKAVALANLGRAAEAEPVYAAIAQRTSGVTRLASLKEQARAAIAGGNFASAADTLRSVPLLELSPDERRLYYLALVQVAVKRQNLSGIVDAYTSATVGLRADDREALHAMIFSSIVETAQHIELENEVRRRLQEDSEVPPSLWYLAADAAHASRRTPNRIEALYRLNLANSGDYEALRALAQAISPVASELATVPDQMLAIPKEDVGRLLQLASDALEATIRANPLVPDNYAPLLAYHQALGTSVTAANAAIAVVARDSKVPQIKGSAAYALAINGYPEAALSLYDEALTIAPDDMHIKMNRASCLTRLNRWDEALEFYYQVLELGFLNQAYHIHELVDRIWRIEKHLGQSDKAIPRFLSILEKVSSERFTETAESMGILMINESRWEDALRFFQEQKTKSPKIEERGHAANYIGQIYLRSGRPLDAAKAYRETAEAYGHFPDLWVDLMHGQAQSLVSAGLRTEAIDVLRRTAERLPGQALAATSMFRAGQVMESEGKSAEAIQAYREFLAGSSSDLALRQAAEERIDELVAESKPSAQ